MLILLLHEGDLVVEQGKQWFFSEGGAHEEMQCPQKNTKEDCYVSRQTCIEGQGFTYSEGGTHKETLCPQRSLWVKNKE